MQSVCSTTTADWDSGHSLGGSYPSAEIQSVYSTAVADWASGHSLGGSDSLQRCSRYILQLQLIKTKDTHLKVLTLSNAVRVFVSHSVQVWCPVGYYWFIYSYFLKSYQWFKEGFQAVSCNVLSTFDVFLLGLRLISIYIYIYIVIHRLFRCITNLQRD